MMGGMGAPAPRYAASIHFKNNGHQPAQVTVTFQNIKDNVDITETLEVAAGAEQAFGPKDINMGSWTAVAPVKSIQAAVHGRSSTMTPTVSGVVRVLPVSLQDGVRLQQGAPGTDAE